MNTEFRLRVLAHILDGNFLGSLRRDAVIGLELPSRNFIDKHLVDLLKASILGLRNKEEEENLNPSALSLFEALRK